jgi:hypothetical protein
LGKDYSGLKFWRREGHFDAGFSKYGGKDASWNERIRLYLLDSLPSHRQFSLVGWRAPLRRLWRGAALCERARRELRLAS